MTSLASRKTYSSGKLRPITRAEGAAFVAAVRALMEGQPITDEETEHSPHCCWTVQTERAGPLHVILYDEQATCFTVFMRFEHPEMARQVLDGLGPSAKWNVHQWQAQDALEQMDSQLYMIRAQGYVGLSI